MKYSNPQIPENVNVGKRHPLTDLLRLLVAVGVLIGVAVFILSLTVGWVARFVPWQFELELAERSESRILDALDAQGERKGGGSEEQALQELANRLSANMDMPEGMTVRVHYIDSDMVNALATLGGQLVFFRGLIEKMPDENTLAMVMAHEIAHVRQRHVISGLGRGLAVTLTLYGIVGASGSAVPESLIGNLGLVSTASFSRQHETESDAIALDALQRTYGHIGGSSTLFRLFQAQARSDGMAPPEFLSTHPAPKTRIERIDRAGETPNYVADGERTPLDARLKP